jgi:hypothetical protein
MYDMSYIQCTRGICDCAYVPFEGHGATCQAIPGKGITVGAGVDLTRLGASGLKLAGVDSDIIDELEKAELFSYHYDSVTFLDQLHFVLQETDTD